MKLPANAFTLTDWSEVAPEEHPGETGASVWRTASSGDLRVRVVDYSAGYVAHYWCDRGHVLYVLDGELAVALRDRRSYVLTPGMSFHVSDCGDAAHRVSTRFGAKTFIVD
jgi:hypothetical protein